MLRTLGLEDHADKISTAVFKVITESKTLTPDLDGTHSTTQFTNEVISAL
jgi:isocitrate dehydrogenase (NAD+)